MKLTPNQFTILEALKDGPRWTRSFQTVKPLYVDLIRRGLIERCYPHLGRARNQLRLTQQGCEAIEVDYDSVPVRMIEERKPVAPPMELGEINPNATPATRKICEAFRRGILDHRPARDLVTELAELQNVQRPAIWKRLRDGGVLQAYGAKRDGGRGRPVGGGTPGYSARRRQQSVDAAAKRQEARGPVPPVVHRDPCPRCGCRGDVACKHSRVPLGTIL